MKEPVTGVQLYTLRDHIKTAADFDKTLARLAEMGVRDVQISGIGKDVTAQEQKESLDRYGMRVCVTHQSYDRILHDLPALIELHQTIGCDALGLGCAPKTARGTLKNIRAFHEKQKRLSWLPRSPLPPVKPGPSPMPTSSAKSTFRPHLT